MPQTEKRWKNVAPPLTSFAVDAKFWNTIVAPRNNLDFLNLISNTDSTYPTEATLTLSYTANIATATPTIIPWSTVVSNTYPFMWDSGNAQTIYLRRNGNDNNSKLWYVDIYVNFGASTQGTSKIIEILPSLDTPYPPAIETVITDAYEETSASGHTTGIFLMTPNTDSLYYPSFTVRVTQKTGTLISLTASISVRMVPSMTANYF